MIALVHVLAWPVAAVAISSNLRRAIGAVCLASIGRKDGVA